MQFSSPTASFGYYRGAPQYLGQGSGMGQNVAGVGQMAQGQGSVGTPTGWTPTILYLFILIVAEMIVFGILSRHI